MRPLKEKISITIDSDTLEGARYEAEKDNRSLSQHIDLALKETYKRIDENRKGAEIFGLFFIFVVFFEIMLGSANIKSAPTEAGAQKTQTPVVAKLTQCEKVVSTIVTTITSAEFAFLSNSYYDCDKNECNYSTKIKSHPYFSHIKLVWHNYCITHF